MEKRKADRIAKKEIGFGFRIESLGTKGNCFIYHGNNDKIIPSDIIIAVNKETGKTGASILDIDEAIQCANRQK